ncbi:MAG: hypothetical protein JXM73_25685 [Anaerolineae bacterium]|nr:hypothetical protein [Anaerolineae bacterium]
MTGKTLGATGARLLTALPESNRTIFSVADAQKLLESSCDAALFSERRLAHAG